MLRYSEMAPDPAIARNVRCFWFLSGGAEPTSIAQQPIVPDGSVEMVFNLADGFERTRANGLTERQASGIVVGQMTGPTTISSTGAIDLVGIRFQPAGAAPAVGAPMDELRDSIMPLELVVPDFHRDLLHALWETPCGTGRVGLLNTALKRRLARAGSEAPAERAVAHIAQTAEPVSVRTLADQMGTGVRRLQRSFARAVGVSPRTLQRIFRFQRFYSRLDTTAQGRWTRLAASCGYYDQAHLIRDFREFTGTAPSMFLSQDTTLSDCFLGRRRDTQEPA